MGFSTQAFYTWRARPYSDRDWHDAHLTKAIVDIHADDPEFGYRFIADELERAGHRVGERRVHRPCRQQRVWSTTTRKGRRGSGKTPGPAVHEDLVRRTIQRGHAIRHGERDAEVNCPPGHLLVEADPAGHYTCDRTFFRLWHRGKVGIDV